MKTHTFSTLIISALLFTATVAGIWFLFAYIRAENTQIAEQQNVIDTTLEQQQRVQSMRILAHDTEEDRALLDSYFISEEGVVDFLEVLESFSDITGATVDISSVAIDSGVVLTDEQRARQLRGEEIQLPPVTAENLRIRIRSEGSWREVVHVLALLETMPVYLAHEDVKIQKLRGEVAGWRGLYEFYVKKLP